MLLQLSDLKISAKVPPNVRLNVCKVCSLRLLVALFLKSVVFCADFDNFLLEVHEIYKKMSTSLEFS